FGENSSPMRVRTLPLSGTTNRRPGQVTGGRGRASGDREGVQQVGAEETDAPVADALDLSQRGKIGGRRRGEPVDEALGKEHARVEADLLRGLGPPLPQRLRAPPYARGH